MTRAEADSHPSERRVDRPAPPGPVVFRMLPRQIALAGLVWLGSVVLLGAVIRGESGVAGIAGGALFALFATAVFAAILTTRVALRDDGLEIVAVFRRRLLPRESIETATWEGSGSVSVRLVGGGAVTLPETGHDKQPRVHAIRVWLQQGRRTAAGGRRAPGRAERGR